MPGIKEKTNIITLAENNLERAIQWVSIIDSKALFILTLILAILGYFFTKLDEFINLLFHLYEKKETILLVIISSTMIIQLTSFVTSIVYLVLVIYPKRNPHTQVHSLFFYETISSMSITKFNNDITSLTTSTAIAEINDQTYNISKVIKKKFDQLSMSIKWFSLGLIIFLIYIIIQAVLSRIYI